MGDLIPLPNGSGNLVVHTREEQLADYEKRLKDAQALEEKLNKINEEVPGRIYNVSGSCAGAGSGDFHYYRLIRRAEQDRQRRLEAADRELAMRTEHETKLQQRQEVAEDKTAKRRGKRQKKKEKKKAAKLTKTGDGDKGGAEGGGGSGSASSDGGGGQPGLD